MNVHVKPKKGDVYGGRLLSERSLQGLGKVGNTWYILQSLNGAIGLDGLVEIEHLPSKPRYL